MQCRDDADSLNWFAPINHLETQVAVSAERAFLAGLGSGCALPVAAYGHVEDGNLHLRGRVLSEDGRKQIDVKIMPNGTIGKQAASDSGFALAQTALAQGAAQLMESK